MPKIALVSNTDFSIYNFRMGLVRALKERGCELHIICPDGEYVPEFTKEGVPHHALNVDRKGKNPLNELRTFCQLVAILKREGFDLIHNYTIKPNIYGALAARVAGVPVVVNSVTGLGYVFTGNGAKKRLLKALVVSLCRITFRFCSMVIFLNDDDREVFQACQIVDRGKGVVIKSEGVDTEKFSPENVVMERVQALRRELGASDAQSPIIVTLIARLLWDKGIREFVEAARILKKEHPDAQFLLVGPIDAGNPAAVPGDYLEKATGEGLVSCLGEREDVREILHISHIVTLPSYREGVPKVLLEAMAMEKPIVTTDSVGCREVVEEGKNGFLVPIMDQAALSAAIERLISDEDLRGTMGRHGRERALKEFDEPLIVGQIIQLYERLLPSGSIVAAVNGKTSGDARC